MKGPWEQYADPSQPKQEEGPWSLYSVAEAADVKAKEQLGTFDYIANEARKGTVDSVVLGQAILDTFVIDPFKKLYSDVTGKPSTAPGGIGERFSRNIERLQKATQPITGARYDTQAPSITAEILGGGARFATDPLGFLGTPIRAARTATEVATEVAAPVAGRTAGLFGIGVTAEAGGQVGEAVEKAVTGEDTGAGRAIGSIAASVKGTAIAPAISTAVTSPFSVGKQVYDKYKKVKEDPDSASQVMATTSAKRLLKAISKETPGNKLDEIVEDFNRISNSINKENLPLLVAMSDNPLVRVEVQRLAKTNPEMRQRIETELSRLAQNIDNRADLLFGQRYAPVVGAEQVTVKNAIKQREAIDSQINRLSENYIPGVSQENIGTAITNLVDARVKAATKEMEPVYTSILADAKKAGAKLPDTAVRDVYNFVVANNIRDIFGKGTAVDKKIMREWGPTEGVGFSPVSFDQVDSLKREINRLQRGSLTRDEARKLNQLEDVLNESRKQIPGNFNDRLRAADLAYYEKVGVPFNAQGIKDIDSKKYAEQVAPVIIKNSSSLRQFLSAVGEEGNPIVRNAIISDVYSKAFTNDAIDPKKLQTYLTKNKEILDQVPEVQQELRNAVVNVGSLQVARKNIDNAARQAQTELADNFVIKVKDSKGVSVPDYKSVTDRMFRDPVFFSKINKDISNLDPVSAKAVRNAMRAEIINTARDFPDGGLTFLSNPRNKKTIESVFGSGYQDAVKDLIKLSDAVNNADVGRLSAVITKADLDTFGKYAANLGFPGLDIPFVTSTIRDRISSTTQKAVRILTRVNTAKMREDTDEAIFDLLFDVDGMKKLQQVSKEMDLSLTNPVTVKNITDKVKDIIPLYVYGATKATVFPPEETEPVEQFPMGGFE